MWKVFNNTMDEPQLVDPKEALPEENADVKDDKSTETVDNTNAGESADSTRSENGSDENSESEESESENDCESDSEDDLPGLMTQDNSELYVINIDGHACYYADSEEDAHDRMWDLARRCCRLTPDWKHYVVRVSENEIHVEREQNWIVISYPEVIHRLRCSTIKKLVPRPTEPTAEPVTEETDKDKTE